MEVVVDIKTLEELSLVLDKVAASLIYGLIVDGSPHKQFYLSKALRDLCGDDFTKNSQAEFQWKDGIEP